MQAPCLVLCSIHDRSAVRVYCALRKRLGADAVELVSGEELALAPRWHHTLDSGHVGTELTLADGRRIETDRMGLVLQRIRQLDMPQFEGSKPDDREYAVTEMQALLLSWLAGLSCMVVNRAGPRGLCGADRGRLEWMTLSVAAGLPTRGFELVSEARRFRRPDFVPHPAVNNGVETDDPPPILRPELLGRAPVQYFEQVDGPTRRVLVVGGRCFDLPSGVSAEACVRLADLSGDHLLEIHLGMIRGTWRVCGATPFPEIPLEAADFVADSLAGMRAAA
jgi:hypothetical protein